ncbi:Na(+)-translocating NADH-quinone reductase subunit F [Candidatus Bilamarchaeum dharawalense]|uniref:Na(+)-translocating NADH-quinone reductase subunit F n=1 Tax=Candidatus Bilamarchaeum dharawalense TaxID=2885759 RepID=A0A5E4LNB8_9ARCH|nr:Na(+)-translocating NADH-quinone reductase subunit F [Candidatus Bilamarchaeum dharawalense]
MAKVKIINDGGTLEIPDGSRLLDYTKETGMLYGCESGQCGTCICKVIKGKENLNSRSASEELILAKRSAQTNERLACQIWIKKGEVEIEY